MTARPQRSARALAAGFASRGAKVGVSAAALFLVLRQVDTESMLRVLAAADRGDVLVVAGLYLLGQGLTAWRWKIIAERVGFTGSMGRFLRFYYVGMFFNLFGPATLGGDFVRALYLGAAGGRRTVAFHTVLFDRLVGLVMLVFAAVGAIALFGRYGLPLPIVWLVAGAGLAMAFGWFLVPPLVRRFFAAQGRANRLLEEDLKPFWVDRGLLVRTASVSVVFHLLQAASLILLGRAVSMEVDWPYYFIFHPLVSVLSALPVSVAGLGIREAGYVWFLQRQGVDQDTAFAFGVLWFAVILTSSLVGGVVYLWSGAAVPTLRGHRASSEVAPGEPTAPEAEAGSEIRP